MAPCQAELITNWGSLDGPLPHLLSSAELGQSLDLGKRELGAGGEIRKSKAGLV